MVMMVRRRQRRLVDNLQPRWFASLLTVVAIIMLTAVNTKTRTTTTTTTETPTTSQTSPFVLGVDALKIAFVGDTGMGDGDDDDDRLNFGKRTFDMIDRERVDLVVDVGDFDYLGKPKRWLDFLEGYDFDFLGASGNAEVKDDYGSPKLWKEYQPLLYRLYQDRIVKGGRGRCRGYENRNFPGTEDEYGERFSCFYGDDDEHHFLFLGWEQGSTEHWRDEAKLDRAKSVEFVNREFKTKESKKAKWRYCIHHMTSAKLSAGGGPDREHMELSGITDACRKHGALIISGHHHLYSRTKVLSSVGGSDGKRDVKVDTGSQRTIREGKTMSITVGMGGYDGNCDGKYRNAEWMVMCVASPRDHRGAVVVEFDEKEPWKGTFRYMNSMKNGAIVDEWKLTNKLNEPRPTPVPTRRPTHSPTRSPTRQPTPNPTRQPTRAPTPKKPTPSPLMVANPTPPPVEDCETIEEIVCDRGNLNTFGMLCSALSVAGLRIHLTKTDSQKTFFVPINRAFQEVLEQDLEGLMANADLMLDLMQYHLVEGQALYSSSGDLPCKETVEMANGETTRTICDGGDDVPTHQRGGGNSPLLAPAIVEADRLACNGVIHVVDRLLLPNDEPFTSLSAHHNRSS